MPYATFELQSRTPAEAALAAEQLLLTTQAASLAVASMIGEGAKSGADLSAVKLGMDERAVGAMENVLYETGLSCQSVICEGEKDGSYELTRLVFGDYIPPFYDLAADPVEMTTAAAKGQPGSMSIAALGERGKILSWIGVRYMLKLVVGQAAAKLLDNGEVRIDGDPADNMRKVSEVLGRPITVAMLKRERNERIRSAAKEIGARIIELDGGDVTPALETILGGGVDMLYSSGGAPEGVITAAAIAASQKGNMQAMMDPQNPEEAARTSQAGLLGKVLSISDLVGDGEVHFAATGITDSPILTGARFIDGQWHHGGSMLASRMPRSNGHRPWRRS